MNGKVILVLVMCGLFSSVVFLNMRDPQEMLKQRNRIHSHRAGYVANHPKPLLTLFATWNTSTEKYLVHNLTLNNWRAFRPHIIPVVFTNESTITQSCNDKGWKVHYVREVSPDGVPLLKHLYLDAMETYDSLFYAYCNSDILFTNTLIETLNSLSHFVTNISSPLLVVGRRTDVEFVTKEEAHSWEGITKVAEHRGELHRDGAADYFITTSSFPWSEIAPVIVGRIGYDNYLMYFSRKANFTVIDATETILAIHQITESGNYEGHRAKNADHNMIVLQQMYTDTRFKNEAMRCIVNYTAYKQGEVKLMRRQMHDACFK